MKILKFLSAIFAFIIVIISCTPEDGPERVPVRDRAEVDIEDRQKLIDYLDTHFWNYEEYATNPAGSDFEIKLDSIKGVNIDKIPLSQQVTISTITREEIDYTIYTLMVREGSGEKSPTFADSAFISYKGSLLEKRKVNDNGDYDQVVFDASTNGVWFDLPRVVSGFMEGVTQFKEATTITPQPDGTLTYENGGIGAVFMPSGAGFFATGTTGIPIYSPLVFTFQLRAVKTTDHDGDGIFSKFEDLNGDRNVRSPDNADNTDEDVSANGPIHNYIDRDDDNDGILTIDENADPNGDGDPSDALDSDEDGIPDYLDADTVTLPTT